MEIRIEQFHWKQAHAETINNWASYIKLVKIVNIADG